MTVKSISTSHQSISGEVAFFRGQIFAHVEERMTCDFVSNMRILLITKLFLVTFDVLILLLGMLLL